MFRFVDLISVFFSVRFLFEIQGPLSADSLRPSSGGADGSFRTHHLLIVGVVSFLIGGVTIAAMALYCWRYCKCSVCPIGSSWRSAKTDTTQCFESKTNGYFNPLQFKWWSWKSQNAACPDKPKYYLPPFTADCGCGSTLRNTNIKYGTLPDKDTDSPVCLTRYGVSTKRNESMRRNQSAPPPIKQVGPERYGAGCVGRGEGGIGGAVVCGPGEELNRRDHVDADTGRRLSPEPLLERKVPVSNAAATGFLPTFTSASDKVSPITLDNTRPGWTDASYTASLQRGDMKRSSRGPRPNPDDANRPRYATVERNNSTKLGSSFSGEFYPRSPPHDQNLHRSDYPQILLDAKPQKGRYDALSATGGANYNYYPTMPAQRSRRPVPPVSSSDLERKVKDDAYLENSQGLPSWTKYNKMTVGQATLKRSALGSKDYPD